MPHGAWWLALVSDAGPRLLLATVGLAAFVVSLALRASAKRKPAPAPAEDLLALRESEAEEAWTPPLRKNLPESTEASEPAEEEVIIWDEQEDVYRPTVVDAEPFVRSLAMKRPPTLPAKQSVIFLRRSAFEKIQAHLKSNVAVELGGLLIGQSFREEARESFLMLIEDALPAAGGEETATSFAYTSESWNALLPQLTRMNAAWTLLGSYHSHPGMGVFLSSTDLETQGAVFSQPWQIALVIDPVNEEVGFFTGALGKPCPHWYLVEDENT